MSEVRVRFAPSPTGYLHVGGARTTLYNYLFARQQKGKFILRVEDTDEARSTNEALRMQMEDLKWLGLDWDEGPEFQTLKDKGPYGPYRQSQRQHIYKEYAEQLLKNGKAYYCFMKDEEIEVQRQAQLAAEKSPHIESPYADWSLEKSLAKIKTGESAVVRFKTKHLKKDYVFQDLVRGEVKFPSDMVGDFVLLRSGGMPVYNFCCVIDDHLMKISHILRAEEHLSNTLRQLMIYEAFNWEVPKIGHISLVLDSERKKLSKRAGATSCKEYRDMGYLPEAMNNYLALLGWSHPEQKEVIPFAEMIEKFSIDRLNSSGAIFDPVKLKWMNAQYLRALPADKLWQLMKPYLDRAMVDVRNVPIEKCIEVFKPYMETLEDSVKCFGWILGGALEVKPTDYDSATQTAIFASPANFQNAKLVVKAWKDELEGIQDEFVSEEDFLKIQSAVQTKTGKKGGNLFPPIRFAVIRRTQGVELKHLVPLIKRSTLILRADSFLSYEMGSQ
jgi:nondiscriminating glutamyl-tRNA synthetase